MNVYYIPTYSDENEYLTNITNGLINNKVNVLSTKCRNKHIAPIDSVIKSISNKSCIVHFNWIENKVNNKSVKGCINFYIIKLWIMLLKMTKTKVCWTMHNKMPHSNDDKDNIVKFYKFFLPKCDMVLSHCSESELILRNEYDYKGKVLCVPHGNYIKDSSIVPEYDDIKDMCFLYFGMISKYKNILLLIRVFKEFLKTNPKASLKIMGKCKDIELDDLIKREIENCANIEYLNKFLSDDEIEQAMNECCAVVLPYDKDSMLNSGSSIMAFSKGRSVIITRFGYIKDIMDKSFVFSYDYNNVEEHYNNLLSQFVEIDKIKEKEQDFWHKKGKEAYEYALNELDWDNICKVISNGYYEILNK